MADSGRSPNDRLTWPPAGDDLEVMELFESEGAGRTDTALQGATTGDRAAETILPPARHTADHEIVPDASRQTSRWRSGFARFSARLTGSARKRPERWALAILALLVVAQGAFIAWGLLGDRFGGVVASNAVAGTAGSGEAHASTAGVGLLPPAPAFPAAAAGAGGVVSTGYLAIRTQPPGAEVSVDGRPLGASPVMVPDITAGEHEVTISSGGRTIRHTATVGAGEVVSLVFPASPATAASAASRQGSLRVRSPIELRVTQGDRVLGTSSMDSMPLAAGSHTVELSNESVGYESVRSVRVSAGRTTTLDVDLPEASVAINAIPWAEVLVDGTRVGETPIGALSLPLGPHDVVLRHPDLGEKSVRTVVKAGEPTRISVDMRN